MGIYIMDGMSDRLDHLRQQYSGKKILVVGLGLLGGGVGIAAFFAKLGAVVTVTDLKTEKQLKSSLNALKNYPITFKLGQHSEADFLEADLIFKAPKMRWDAPEIVAALAHRIPVEMEVSFFLKNCHTQVIGVTGSRGKSTTAYMIYELLKKTLSHSVYMAGNVPNVSTIQLLEVIQPGDTVVLEISSWQLSALHRAKVSPPIAVFTSFYPDHLDYYHTIDEYLEDKKAVFMYQTENDHLILNKQVEQYLQGQKIPSHILTYSAADFPMQLMYLKGEHNRENAAAVLKVAQVLDINQDRAAAKLSFLKGLPHRQERVRTVNKVTFINDTTSTTPIATVKAIEALPEKPLVLILGGNAKNLPFPELIMKLNSVSYIVLLKGSFTDEILPELQERYAGKISKIYVELKQAVQCAYQKAKELGEAYVLFSPGATSFSMFTNEFHRGEEFMRIVSEL